MQQAVVVSAGCWGEGGQVDKQEGPGDVPLCGFKMRRGPRQTACVISKALSSTAISADGRSVGSRQRSSARAKEGADGLRCSSCCHLASSAS